MTTTISNDIIKLVIAHKGAQMQSLTKDGLEYLWQGDARFWADRAINLFPFNGRLHEQRYTFNGKSFSIPMHGFALGMDFEVKNITSDSVDFVANDNDYTCSVYPFHFQLVISYRLSSNSVIITYKVINRDESTMFFALGGHPGFCVPLDKGDFQDYSINFDKLEQLTLIGFDNKGLINGERWSYPLTDNSIPLNHDDYRKRNMFFADTNGYAKLCSHLTSRSVTLRYPDMDILGLWKAESEDAKYICIEPWSALPGRSNVVEDISTKPDMTSLDAGKTYTNEWSITLE